MERKLKLSRTGLLPENATCEHCVDTLVAELEQERGISHAHRDSSGQLCLHYDESWVEEELLRRARLRGSDVQRRYQHRQWAIAGLDCGDCVRTVEEGVASLDGVLSVRANLATGKVAIEFEESRLDDSVLRARLASIGHAVEVAAPAPSDTEEPRVARWRRRLLSREWRPLVLGGLAALAGILASVLNLPAPAADAAFALAVLLGGWDIGLAGIRQLFASRRLTVDLLMSIAAVGALLLGEYAEGAAVVLLFVLGESLERVTMERARRSIRSLMALAPDNATRLLPDGVTEVVPVEELRIGDRLLVRPGERMAMDGVVVEGSSAVDQSPITGESIPVARGVGDEVFAGSINGLGALAVRVSRRSKDNTLSRVIAMVEEAQNRRAPAQRFVDRFALWYTPLVVVAALLVALLPPLLLGWEWTTAVHRALVLLVISCPCALVISTPVSIISAVSNAARRGVLIKGGTHLEALGNVRAIAFDKTGTLTLGRPTVTEIVALDGAPEDGILSIVAAVERHSEHPLAAAILRAASERGLASLPVEGFTAIAGRGAAAIVAGEPVRVGNRALIESLSEEQAATLATLEEHGNTVIIAEVADRVVGLIAVADEVRPEARDAIATLKALGIERTVMLTGDNERTARAIGAAVGVDEVRAGLLPHEKVAAVEALQAEWGTVAMVGDGVNDAPALAASTVGIAMGAAGTDQALEVADVALMADDLTKLAWAVKLSRAANGTIRRNIAFSLGVKALFMLLALPGWTTLWMAVFADDGASLLVTGNGMRLLRYGTRNSPDGR